MRVYFLLRKLSLTLRKEQEKYLPLTNPQNCVPVDETLDLSKLNYSRNEKIPSMIYFKTNTSEFLR